MTIFKEYLMAYGSMRICFVVIVFQAMLRRIIPLRFSLVLEMSDISLMTPISISRKCSFFSNSNFSPSLEFWDSVVDRLINVYDPVHAAPVVHILDRIAASGAVPAKLDLLVSKIQTAKLKGVDKFLVQRALFLLGYAEAPEISLDDLNAVSTVDLITSLMTSGRVAIGNGLCERPNLLKSAALELIRRIELSTVSPHACVEIVTLFSSGVPPLVIHPLLLQAAYASLLSNRNYLVLTPSELETVLHASVVSGEENIVLTREIVLALLEGKQTCSPRLLSGLSGSKSFIPNTFIHELTMNINTETTHISLILNLLMNGICQVTVSRYLRKSIKACSNWDLIDLGSLALAVSVSRGLLCPPSISAPVSSAGRIPSLSLEITEKANPAMPRSDIKKARLAKRYLKRADSIFDSLDWPTPSLGESKCIHSPPSSLAPLYRAINAQISESSDSEALGDIMESIWFLRLESLSLIELKLIHNFVCKVKLGNRKLKLPMEERRGDETSVNKLLRNLGVNTTMGHTVFNTRIGIVISSSTN